MSRGFTSDNGPEKSWSGRLEKQGHDSRGALKGGKSSVYEGGHRVPSLVRWPQGIKQPGRQWDKIVGQVDLMATFAELVGAELPATAGEDSQNFASVLLDPNANYDRLPLITYCNGGGSYRYAITDGDWKLIVPEKNKGLKLYNLFADRAETNNIAENHPEKVADLKKRITENVARGRTTPGPPQQNDTGYWEDLHWMTKDQYQQ